MSTVTLDESFAAPAGEAALARAAEALQGNGFTAHRAGTIEEARKLVAGLVPRDQPVFTSLSETLRLAGILDDLDGSGDYLSVRAGAAEPQDIYDKIRLGSQADVVVGSVHAVTEEGHLVVGSASGSQFAAYASGARKAIWVVGAQKVVPDLPTALRRIRTYSYPREDARLRALGQASFLAKFLILEKEAFPDRGHVVLVGEPIGF